MKYIFIIFIICCSLTSCGQSNNSPKLEIVDNTLNEYINSKFKLIDSLSIRNSEIDKLFSYINKKSSKEIYLDSVFVSKYLCDISNNCIDQLEKTKYFPIGRIDIDTTKTVLIYEKFKSNKFPRLFDEAYVLLFDRNDSKVLDKLFVYKDYDVGPINCGEIDFSINKKEINIKYKKCKKYSPNNEKERHYKNMIMLNEYYTIKNGKFILLRDESFQKIFDSFNRIFIGNNKD